MAPTPIRALAAQTTVPRAALGSGGYEASPRLENGLRAFGLKPSPRQTRKHTAEGQEGNRGSGRRNSFEDPGKKCWLEAGELQRRVPFRGGAQGRLLQIFRGQFGTSPFGGMIQSRETPSQDPLTMRLAKLEGLQPLEGQGGDGDPQRAPPFFAKQGSNAETP